MIKAMRAKATRRFLFLDFIARSPFDFTTALE
jgi:hypothetical protein